MTLDHKKLAVIHIVKREMGLSDDEYRDLLQRETGVRSAKDLDDKGFRRLMRFFAASSHYRINKNGRTFRQKLFIRHLVDDLGWDGQHFQNFLDKYYHKTEIDELTKSEASKAIESLKNILKHERDKG
ncbi:MAG: regulatory protein GemA [Proteobacteria bacterium]|nr:regulatory protein GemA [Pseudomonadota bacterium]MBU1454587.1 regulatory protein GemA [Pseudomonadota bacterium]